MSSVSRDCLGYLQDALDEHTPPFSPPETWGTEWDADVWELGPPCPPDAVPELDEDDIADFLERMRYEWN